MDETPDREATRVVVEVSARTPPYQVMHLVLGVAVVLTMTVAREAGIWK